MEAFSKFIAIVILSIAIFMVPIMYTSEQHDSITQSYASEKVTTFVETVKKQGRITQKLYDDFRDALGNTGNVYDIELVHRHKYTTPNFDADGNIISVSDYEICYYTDEILEKIFTMNIDTTAGDVPGEYRMSKGDYFTVKLKNKNITTATRLKNIIFGSEFPVTNIFVTYGGTIQDENY